MSAPINDGGPAFPTPGEDFIEGPQGRLPASAWGMQGSPGMSLRDWFAGQALAGVISACYFTGGPASYAEVAEQAYAYADSMLAARKGGQS